MVTGQLLLGNRSYTVHVQTGRLLSITAYFAGGNVVLSWSFSGTSGTTCQMFRKKTVPFHPAGGESVHVSRQTHGLEPTA